MIIFIKMMNLVLFDRMYYKILLSLFKIRLIKFSVQRQFTFGHFFGNFIFALIWVSIAMRKEIMNKSLKGININNHR